MSDINDPDLVKPVDWKLSDIATAMSLLTRFPLPTGSVDATRLAAAAWAFPLVGLALGLLAGLLLQALVSMGFSGDIAAACSLGLLILMTGGLHEDGIADCADGLGGGQTKEAALKIMKDSTLGTYGVVTLIIFLLVRWSAISDLALVSPILSMMLVGMASRLPMVLVMAGLKHARTDGLSKHVGRPNHMQAITAFVLTSLFSVVVLGWWALLFVPLTILSCLPLVLYANRKIGGQTGDILGGTQQSGELVALALLTLIWI